MKILFNVVVIILILLNLPAMQYGYQTCKEYPAEIEISDDISRLEQAVVALVYPGAIAGCWLAGKGDSDD